MRQNLHVNHNDESQAHQKTTMLGIVVTNVAPTRGFNKSEASDHAVYSIFSDSFGASFGGTYRGFSFNMYCGSTRVWSGPLDYVGTILGAVCV